MKNILILLFVIISINVQAFTLKGTWYKPPRGASPLGPSVFVHASYLKNNQLIEGDVVWVKRNKKRVQARIYDFLREKNKFAMSRRLGKMISLQSGQNAIQILKTKRSDRRITPKPLGFNFESYPSNDENWQGFVLSAPHGDSDLFTGEVVKLTNKLFNIPASAAYGCRLTYKGKWFDCNRPLQRPSNHQGGVKKERLWSNESIDVYRRYQQKIEEHGKAPYRFFISFHGHDLTVKKAGKTYSRNVIEAMGIGLSISEIKEIKLFYKRNISRYFKNPPKLVFGNLKNDLNYKTNGVKTRFVYSAIGARTYGTLRSNLILKGLHIESPNSMRLTSLARKKTARFLHVLLKYIKNNILKEQNNYDTAAIYNFPIDRVLIAIQGGPFKMGAQVKNLWDNEYPSRNINMSSFSIDKYEITNYQFAQFLNDNKKNIKNIEAIKEIKKASGIYSATIGRENYPIRNINFETARSFCKFYGGDLPTEAQWEFAASMDLEFNKKYLFANGKNIISEGDLNFENSTSRGIETTPVGSFPSLNPNQLMDMGGNVWEWTRDNYRSDYYKYSVESSDPKGPKRSTMRTIRGGAYNTESIATRTSMRIGIHPKEKLINLGFRCIQK